MKYTTTYKLEDFILKTQYNSLPDSVKERIKGCFIDLMGALIVGSRSEQFETGLRLAETVYGKGNIAVIGSNKRFSFMGAGAAMGHSSNAYDIDDGHNLIRAHPGTSFIGALIAAGYEKYISRNDFFSALLVAYETTIRMGAAIMDYYKYAHSSGTFGAVGVAAGVGRIYGFDRVKLNHALSVAEFNAPLVPGIRSVEYPSMNKDGVPFGVMIGMLAVMDVICGFEGNKNLLEAEDYCHYLDDLGEKYEVMQLYFKPYTCCRWAHPAIDACLSLVKDYNLKPEDIKKVTIETFHRATLLSKIVPKTADEAQYNIAYPVASAIINGDFGYGQICPEALCDKRVTDMMEHLCFVTDPQLDEKFPAKRFCRAKIQTVDGRSLCSDLHQPRGEAEENIGLNWLCDKFSRITAPLYTKEGQDALISLIVSEKDVKLREIIDTANLKKFWKKDLV